MVLPAVVPLIAVGLWLMAFEYFRRKEQPL